MLSYDGRKVVPAPVITINKNYSRTEDGQRLGAMYDLTLAGMVLPFKGSPSGHYASVSGAFWTLGGYPPDELWQANNEEFHSILRKQEALRWLFSRDGKSLEWQPAGGQPVVKCNPRILGIEFAQGVWAEKCDYTVQCQADWLYLNGTTNKEDTFGNDLITSANENWSLETLEGQDGTVYQVSHEISAQAVNGFNSTGANLNDKEAWQHARDWCNGRVAGSVPFWVTNPTISGTTWVGGNYTKSFIFSRTDGRYNIVESWTICPANTFVEKTFTCEYDPETDQYLVRCEGVVHGLNGNTGSATALSIARAQIPNKTVTRNEAIAAVGSLLGGKVLATDPDATSITLNQVEGTAGFVYEWTTATSSTHVITHEAQYGFNVDTNIYIVSLSTVIQGKGATPATKLTNALAAVPADSAALTKAKSLVGTLPNDAVLLSTAPVRARSKVVNEPAGRISLNWAWDTSDANATDINVSIQNPAQVVAILPIPGRAGGPIIQDMRTATEKYVTVSLRGKGYAQQPSSLTMFYKCRGYVPLDAAEYVVPVSDTENWNPKTLNYDRSIRFLIRRAK